MMVVDDHEQVREAVVALLSRAADMVVCAQASSIAETEMLAAACNPDVVVIDLHMGDLSSIEAARRIRSASPRTQTVMLTAASDRDALLASILAGAASFLPKQLRGTDLVGTVRRVGAGERLLDPAAITGLLDELGYGLRTPVGTRGTGPDVGLLSLLAAGRTDEEIEAVLGVDDKTVKVRVARLMTAIAGPERIRAAGARAPVRAAAAVRGEHGEASNGRPS